MLRRLACALMAAVLFTTACGGRAIRNHGQVSDGGSSPGSGGAGAGGATGGDAGAAGAPSVLDTLCASYAELLCTYYTTCESRGPYRDVADCEAELDCYGVPGLVAAVAAGHLSVDEDALPQCLADLYANLCDPARYLGDPATAAPDIYGVLSSCPGVLLPQQGVGDSCYGDAECGTRLQCQGLSCPGVCAPRYELGAPCDVEHEQCSVPYGICLGGTCRIPTDLGTDCADDNDCLRDLLCAPDTHTCVEPPERPGVGGSCIRDFNGGKPAVLCQPGLYCDDNDDLGSPGVCKVLAREGEPCDYQGCQTGLTCVALGGGPLVCHGKTAAGELCEYATDSCQGDLLCVPQPDAPAPTGICEVAPSFGEACPVYYFCAPGLTCKVGVCIHAAYLGDACGDADTECLGSRCVDRTCQPHARVGEACSVNEDCLTRCESGVCVDETTCTP